MISKTCFVIMAIGDQEYNNIKIAASDLKGRYDNLIKEALLKVRPGIEIIRADDISGTGAITTDIVQRIMYSDYVIADVSYPNPNVFYELGLRHACKPGTIIIKDKNARVPFDIASLRYIEYDDSVQGLKILSENLAKTMDAIDKNPNKPDNHFLDVAQLTSFKFPEYSKKEEPAEVQLMKGVLQSPKLMELMMNTSEFENDPEKLNQLKMMQMFFSDPNISTPFLQLLSQNGQLRDMFK